MSNAIRCEFRKRCTKLCPNAVCMVCPAALNMICWWTVCSMSLISSEHSLALCPSGEEGWRRRRRRGCWLPHTRILYSIHNTSELENCVSDSSVKLVQHIANGKPINAFRINFASLEFTGIGQCLKSLLRNFISIMKAIEAKWIHCILYEILVKTRLIGRLQFGSIWISQKIPSSQWIQRWFFI